MTRVKQWERRLIKKPHWFIDQQYFGTITNASPKGLMVVTHLLVDVALELIPLAITGIRRGLCVYSSTYRMQISHELDIT